jgi:hypothetical protein
LTVTVPLSVYNPPPLLLAVLPEIVSLVRLRLPTAPPGLSRK